MQLLHTTLANLGGNELAPRLGTVAAGWYPFEDSSARSSVGADTLGAVGVLGIHFGVVHLTSSGRVDQLFL